MRPAAPEHVAVGGRPRKGPAKAAALGIRAPEDDTNVQAPRDGPIQHIKQRATVVRHLEVVGKKRDCQPHAMLCFLDHLADPSKGRYSVDQRPHGITRPDGIRARSREGYVRQFALSGRG
jgi:hypothetical protein